MFWGVFFSRLYVSEVNVYMYYAHIFKLNIRVFIEMVIIFLFSERNSIIYVCPHSFFSLSTTYLVSYIVMHYYTAIENYRHTFDIEII